MTVSIGSSIRIHPDNGAARRGRRRRAGRQQRPGLPHQTVDFGGRPGHRPAHLLEQGTGAPDGLAGASARPIWSPQHRGDLVVNVPAAGLRACEAASWLLDQSAGTAGPGGTAGPAGTADPGSRLRPWDRGRHHVRQAFDSGCSDPDCLSVCCRYKEDERAFDRRPFTHTHTRACICWSINNQKGKCVLKLIFGLFFCFCLRVETASTCLTKAAFRKRFCQSSSSTTTWRALSDS